MPVHLHNIPKSVTPFKDKGIKIAINGKSGFVPYFHLYLYVEFVNGDIPYTFYFILFKGTK